MHIQLLSTRRFRHTLIISVLMSALIVAVAASLGRAMINLNAALSSDTADLAVYLLLPEEGGGITQSLLLRDNGTSKDYLIYTKKEGTKLVKLEKADKWRVVSVDPLHE